MKITFTFIALLFAPFLMAQQELDKKAEKASSYARITWHRPNEYMENIQNIVTDKSFFEIQLNAEALKPMIFRDFKMFIDNIPVEAHIGITSLPPKPKQATIYTYIYSRVIEFRETKTYQVRVELTLDSHSVTSRTMFITYSPRQPNLHILSIGTTDSDAKYLAKDAKDFATTLKKQAKGLFNQIDATILADSSETTYLGICRAFNKLKNRFTNDHQENRIFPKDYLIVFISCMSKTSVDKGWKLLPSDYNSADGDYFAIDYQDIVLSNLAEINCHKIIFIDTNNSGTVGLKTTGTDMTTITSCSSNECSYEDPEWQNGAFTKALIEALSNISYTNHGKTFSSDVNKDRMITIGEIYNFIRQRVPNLVETYPRRTGQNPTLTDNNSDLDVPIVSY